MGWNIGVRDNTLRIPENYRQIVEDRSEGCVDYIDEDGEIGFNSDAMEHMDFLWQEWVADLQKVMKAEGDVVFMSDDGDDAGEIWGYRFKADGSLARLIAHVTMVEV